MRQNPWVKRKNLYSSPIPRAVSKPKVKWRFLPILWMALKKTCMLLGAVVMISAIMISWTVSSVVEEMDFSLPNQMVLYMELDGDLGDLPKEVSFMKPFADTGTTMKHFIDNLDRAKNDPRVEGIYARLLPGKYSVAHLQELRRGFKDFQASGKFAYIYASSYSSGLGSYYLASAFEEVWMQPMGILAITGLNAEAPFLRGVLDKIGIEPQFFQRKEYKSAYESLTNSEMSDKNRSMTKMLVGDIAEILQGGIVEDERISNKDFKKLVDHGIFTADEALAVGLIDVADYADNLVKKINERVTGDADNKDLAYINFGVYMADMDNGEHPFAGSFLYGISGEEEFDDGRPRVALIYAVGAIMDSAQNSYAPSVMVDDGVAAADEIASALLEAAEDDTIDAIVLRVDSPGGSPVASETILRAVEKNQEKGKSVTVSMGPVAASGGYWISASADQIFVLPSTITGSIGVLGGKVSAMELWKNIGVNWENVKWGKNSAIWSMNTPFSKSEAERMNAILDNTYDNFLKRVAKGRKMSVDDVNKIAGGRVWTGKRAVEIGLADQLGGLNEALDYAAVKVGGKNRNDVNIIVLPRPLSSMEQFLELLEGQVKAGQIIGLQAGAIKELTPLIREFMIMNNQQDYSTYAPMIIR